jgi:uncharacterized protein YqeY
LQEFLPQQLTDTKVETIVRAASKKPVPATGIWAR